MLCCNHFCVIDVTQNQAELQCSTNHTFDSSAGMQYLQEGKNYFQISVP